MRILFISNFFPPYELGGYEQLSQEVAERLMVRGHEIVVLTSRYGKDQADNRDSYHVVRTLYLESDIDFYHPIDFFVFRSFRNRANLRELHNILDQFKPDVIMIWGMWNLSQNLAYWAEKWLPRRVVYYVASYWPIDLDPHTSYWQLEARRSLMKVVKQPLRILALKHLDKEKYPPRLNFQYAVCCSQYVRNTLVKAGKLSSQAGVIRCGIDPEPFIRHSQKTNPYDGNRPLRLLYFGRLVHDKGVHTAIEALGLLKEKGLIDRLELTILGNGHPEYKAKLFELVKKFDINDQVKFIAQVSRKEIPELLHSFDVYLFTSLWPEPLARSVMEAMASGLLVIGAEVGGQVEMLANEQNALTFQAGDTISLASQITRVLDNPSLCLSLASAGTRLILEQFTLESMVDKIELHLIKLLI